MHDCVCIGVYVLVFDNLYKLATKVFKQLLAMHGMSVDVHSLIMRKGPGSWTNKSASYTTFMYVCMYVHQYFSWSESFNYTTPQ